MLKHLALWPLSLLYHLGVRVRNLLFDWGVLPSTEFDIPVICIGNITIGGTGKTPHTEAIISILQQDLQVACLSRGYKRKSTGFVLANEHSTPEEIGDEPKQIKQKFPHITVAVDANRVRGIKKILQQAEQTDVIILDDGFQHRYVKADINILLMDFNRPVYQDHLLPLGRLREGLSAIDRANYVIVTKCPPNITPIEKRIISKYLNLKAYQELLFSTMRYGEAVALDGKAACTLTSASNILCVTGIAQPAPYHEYLRTKTENLIPLVFPDHYMYKPADVKRICETFDRIEHPDKYIFTTEKDAVRLSQCNFPDTIRERIFYIPIEPEFLTSKEQLIKNIYNYVRRDKRK